MDNLSSLQGESRVKGCFVDSFYHLAIILLYYSKVHLISAWSLVFMKKHKNWTTLLALGPCVLHVVGRSGDLELKA